MLINCPRCGFSQPKDQYCAQCGVDMDSYKPKSVPLTTRIRQSTKTHIILLLVTTVFVGQYVIRSEEPQRWVQKITRSQGVTSSKAKFSDDSNYPSGVTQSASEVSEESSIRGASTENLDSLRNRELQVVSQTERPIEVGNSANGGATDSTTGKTETTETTFRIIYAEVPSTLVAKWIADSSSSGLYQNLNEYSAGIIADFRRQIDSSMRILKASEKKLSPTQSDTNFSGTVGEESGEIIGIATNLEFRSQQNGSVHGGIMVNRTQKNGRENFPAEFDLPRGAALFLLGAIKLNSFPVEREQLNMPPFQIFKSPDFLARKTEFVIILEPEYK